MGWLRLTLQGSMLTSNIITPSVRVNGWPVPAHYGDNLLPVWAGPNRVDVVCQWILPYGRATLACDVPPGVQVPVYYAAPWHQLSRGAIGHQRQQRPGLLGFALLMGVIAVFVVLTLAGPSLLAH
jgi:hypothetical protein